MDRKSKKLKKVCLFCEKEFEVYPCEFERRKYCSKECHAKDILKAYHIKKTVILQCKICKKKCEVQNWRKNTFKYCSKKCLGIANRGRHLTDDAKEKISNFHKGRTTITEQGREILRTRMKKNNPSKLPEVREKIRIWHLGRKASIETIRKKKKYKPTEKTKAAIRIKTIERINKQKEEVGIQIPCIGEHETEILNYIENKIKLPIIRQKLIDGYYVDGYIESLNICIEIDEYHHRYSKEKDKIRENNIKEKLNCKFIRIGDTMKHKIDEKYEKEIDDVINNEITPDENQDDSLDPSVEKYLNEMGYVWDRLQKKFQEDNICFQCKESVKGKKTFVLEANKSDKGVFVLACVCEDCFNKLKEGTKDEKVKNGRK